MTRLGYQIPNFTYPGVGSDRLFDVVAAQAIEAEESGFDTVLVMDHFYQLPMLGAPENAMLECYTLLRPRPAHRAGAPIRARHRQHVSQPAVLAREVTTLDVVSHGRAQLGIGAGWFGFEHDSLGFEFGDLHRALEKLEEALQIILPMLRGEWPTLEGRWYRVRDAINSPAPVGRIPVLIGGGGEKKTLRMVAQYADESNIICAVEDILRKLEALAAHCARLGRDPGEITVTYQTSCVIAPTHEEAVADFEAAIARTPELGFRRGSAIVGSPAEVGAARAQLLTTGIDGFTVNLPANAHIPGRVCLLGRPSRRCSGLTPVSSAGTRPARPRPASPGRICRPVPLPENAVRARRTTSSAADTTIMTTPHAMSDGRTR